MMYEKEVADGIELQGKSTPELQDVDFMPLSHRAYYICKPLLHPRLRLFLRRQFVRFKEQRHTGTWPIYDTAAAQPAGWTGWPCNKRFALLLTHDVDSLYGNDKLLRLINLEKSLGFTSTVFFVPEWYKDPEKHHELLRMNRVEIAVHGLKHDGKLYQSKNVFNKNAERINYYLNRWGSAGFRAPCMHHNLAWHHRLNILYDASTYDTDPFEPQGGGVGTIFPFTVTEKGTGHSYVELPYTMPQDYLLFVLMQLRTISIWKRKLDWVAAKGGMAHLITHPDYMRFDDNGGTENKYPSRFYKEILLYIKETYAGQYWSVTAQEMANFWRTRTDIRDRK